MTEVTLHSWAVVTCTGRHLLVCVYQGICTAYMLWEITFNLPTKESCPRMKTFSVAVNFFFFNFHKASPSTLIFLTENLQFLITTNCTLSSRISNPRESFGMHWISPVESVSCLAASAATKLLSIFLFSPLGRESNRENSIFPSREPTESQASLRNGTWWM